MMRDGVDVDPMDRDAVVIKVIRTNNALIGSGQPSSPVRRLTQFYTLDGQLLATVDPWKDEATAKLSDEDISLIRKAQSYSDDFREGLKRKIQEVCGD